MKSPLKSLPFLDLQVTSKIANGGYDFRIIVLKDNCESIHFIKMVTSVIFLDVNERV